MPKGYRIRFETPGSKCNIEADSIAELESVVPARFAGMFGGQGKTKTAETSEIANIDEAAKEMSRKYTAYVGEHRRRRSHSIVKQTGVELDVIRCYMQGMPDRDIIDWLKQNKSVTISSSAVGRFLADLFKASKTTGEPASA
jgi:hypothetical protein